MTYDYTIDGFNFIRSPWGDLLVVEFENYIACSDYAKSQMITGFRIHWWGENILKNGSFLDFNKVETLILSPYCIKDCSFIMRHPELKNFSIGTGSENYIEDLDFSYFPNIKNLEFNWHSNYKNFNKLVDIETLSIWYYSNSEKSLRDLINMVNLRILNLVLSKCESLDGIEHLFSLKYLKIGNNKNLVRFCKGEVIDIPLVELWIEQCKKLEISSIPFLKKLKILRIINNGKIDTVRTLLEKLPNLTNLIIVQTELLEGDLNYLLEHPKLERVTIDHKKHYNMKEKEINLLLAEKYKNK